MDRFHSNGSRILLPNLRNFVSNGFSNDAVTIRMEIQIHSTDYGIPTVHAKEYVYEMCVQAKWKIQRVSILRSRHLAGSLRLERKFGRWEISLLGSSHRCAGKMNKNGVMFTIREMSRLGVLSSVHFFVIFFFFQPECNDSTIHQLGGFMVVDRWPGIM